MNMDSVGIPSASSYDFSKDSIFQNFRKSIVDIEAPDENLLNSGKKVDSLVKRENWLPALKGQLDLGYEYGLLTGYIDPTSTAPLNVFNTRGDIAMDVLKLPFNVSYNYSTFKNPLGVNNYFRASLDTEQLKQNALNKKNETVGELDNSIEKIGSQKDLVKGKLGMGEVLKQKLKREIEQKQKELSSYEAQLDGLDKKGQQSVNNVKQNASDSLNMDQVSEDKKHIINNKSDSLRAKYNEAKMQYNKAIALYDTVNALYLKAQNIYTTYSDWQSQLDDKKKLVDGFKNKYSSEALKSSADGKKESFLSNVKTFDLGLTYPNTTALSKNSAPVQGINFEMQRENWYTAVCSGVTMNNLMVSTDVINNKLTNSQNLFNQFDFQNIQERGWLTTIKTGYGTKEGTHYFIGFRYLTNSPDLLVDSSL